MNGVVGNNCGIVNFARETVKRKLGETVAMKDSIGERLSMRPESGECPLVPLYGSGHEIE
jgi:hypothetical protein